MLFRSDLLGVIRQNKDRIKNIVILGVNTFGFSYANRGLEPPTTMPKLLLDLPSGETLEFGELEAGKIEGSAVSFAQVVTQTRHYKDTDLRVTGQEAIEWMNNAQCFAGSAEPVPKPGSRHLNPAENLST